MATSEFNFIEIKNNKLLQKKNLIFSVKSKFWKWYQKRAGVDFARNILAPAVSLVFTWPSGMGENGDLKASVTRNNYL